MDGVTRFKNRQNRSEEFKKLVAEQRKKHLAKRAKARKRERDKQERKAQRAHERLVQRHAAEVHFRSKAEEIIQRRWQGQSARQIAPIVGVSMSRIRKYFRECNLSDAD